MTTKPKARKFRIKRNTPSSTGAAAPAAPEAPEAPAQEPRAQHPQQPPQQPQQPRAHDGQVSSAREMTTAQQIDAIRAEGLTGRQLRMARRMAQKHGLAPTSDFDAVRLLRAKGIDPFQRASILELVVPEEEQTGTNAAPASGAAAPAQPGTQVAQNRAQLPQTVPVAKMAVPSTDVSPAERRSKEIMNIQRDIARRRRRKLALLFSRLAAFVFLPTLIAGYYYYAVATPMYSTKSEFLILSADNAGGSGLGGLLSGTQFATNQDAIATQSFLQSKDAMLRLDEDHGLKSHFSQDWIDPIQRLSPDASNEEAYKIYKKFVTLGYDPTEGVIRMEVAAADPEVSAEFSRSLLAYAEDRVDELSQRKREDAMRTAQQSLEDAKAQRREAQMKMVELQEGTLLDPEGEIANIRALIQQVETQLLEKQIALETQLNNTRPNRARVDALRTEVRLLTERLEQQNARLNEASSGSDSLARKTAEIQLAQADLASADLILQSALENYRQNELEAGRQVRYLTVSVNPVASQDPSYPRSFENTVLAFLIFAGIYLMISLTASILREQVSS